VWYWRVFNPPPSIPPPKEEGRNCSLFLPRGERIQDRGFSKMFSE